MKMTCQLARLGVVGLLAFSATAFAGGNATPTFTQGATLTRVSGAPPINAKIGVVSDQETPAQNLVVTFDQGHSGAIVQNIVVAANGDVTADVGVACDDGHVIGGGVTMRVSDGQASSTGQYIVNIFRKGDLNNDGFIDIFDIVAHANFIVGNVQQGVAPFLAPIDMARMDAGETIDIFDLQLIAAKIVGNATCPP
jgi:hypothetical protein